MEAKPNKVVKAIRMEIEIEEDVAQKLKVMCEFKKLTPGEIVNKAMKKFITQHSDYFPGGEQSG